DDALDPAGAVVHQLPPPVVAIAHRLLEERSEEVVDVRPAGDDPAVDEELRGRLGRHAALLLGAGHGKRRSGRLQLRPGSDGRTDGSRAGRARRPDGTASTGLRIWPRRCAAYHPA